MHPADIQAALKKKGWTQKAVARKLGIAANTVSVVINKQAVSDPVMTAIAEIIGRNKAEVFPEYYLAPPKRSTSKVMSNQ